MSERRAWTQNEDQTISQLVNQYGKQSWTKIGKMLGNKCKTPPRSGKQCRERWYNHIDPKINKNQKWSKEEEDKLFELHSLYGNKWALIAEQMQGRTDNSIKNYFYSVIRRSLRRMIKFLGSKNSTAKIKKIKPSTLSKIFAIDHEKKPIKCFEQSEYLNYQIIKQEIIKFSKCKPNKNCQYENNNLKKYEQLIQKVSVINNLFEQNKKDDQQSIRNEQKENQNISELDSVIYSFQDQNNRQDKVSLIQTIQKQQQNLKQARSMKEIYGKSQNEANPQFYFEIKDEAAPNIFNVSFNIAMSPGFYFNTPTFNSPFRYYAFDSPYPFRDYSIPYSFSLQPSIIDEYQHSLKKQIEKNLSKKSQTSHHSIFS